MGVFLVASTWGSATPPTNLNAITQPSSREMKLAERLVTGLSRLTGLAQPGDMVAPSTVRRDLGVVLPQERAGEGVEGPLTNGH